MKLILLSMVILGSVCANAYSPKEWTAQDFCNLQAEVVEEICAKSEGEAQLRCFKNEMEAQDFYIKKDFIIDSDQTIYCLSKGYFKELPN